MQARIAEATTAISPDLASWIAPKQPAEIPPTELAEIQPAEALLQRLDVRVVRNSRVPQIRFTSQDPQLAASMANLAAELCIADQLDAKADQPPDG
ncbi:MAG: hypothetical protein O9325_03050 [Roseomonas sp.]|nr:hypothetical protein [Roseomonas sp.]